MPLALASLSFCGYFLKKASQILVVNSVQAGRDHFVYTYLTWNIHNIIHHLNKCLFSPRLTSNKGNNPLFGLTRNWQMTVLCHEQSFSTDDHRFFHQRLSWSRLPHPQKKRWSFKYLSCVSNKENWPRINFLATDFFFKF